MAGLGLISSRRFGPLFWTQALSAFNDNALKNAFVLMIAYGATAVSAHRAQLLIPLAGGLFILPFFLCSATAGAIADASDKARLIRLIKFAELVVMALAAIAVIAGSPTVLFALLFVMGIEAAFFGPVKYAILPDLLSAREILLGNALVEAGTFLAILLGTIAGTLIATRHGGVWVAALIVLVALAACGTSLGIPPVRPAGAPHSIEWNLFAATARLVRGAAREPVPLRAMLGVSWFWLVGAIYLSQFPAYVRFVLDGAPAVVTLFMTIFSVGIAAGSLLCTRILRGRVSSRTVPWGALGIALFSIDLWLASPAASGSGQAGLSAFLMAPAHWRIFGDLFGISLSGGLFIVPLYAVLQTASEPQRRAATIAANNVLNAAAMVLSAVATTGLIAVGVTIPGLFLLTGAATIPVAALFRRLLPDLQAQPALGDGD